MILLDAEPHLFETDELLAVEVQARLDMNIDPNATRGRLELPPQRPQQIAGQQALESE